MAQSGLSGPYKVLTLSSLCSNVEKCFDRFREACAGLRRWVHCDSLGVKKSFNLDRPNVPDWNRQYLNCGTDPSSQSNHRIMSYFGAEDAQNNWSVDTMQRFHLGRMKTSQTNKLHNMRSLPDLKTLLGKL